MEYLLQNNTFPLIYKIGVYEFYKRENEMERTIDLLEISDGKIYGLNDMVKLCADHCKGCSACCHGRGDTITLDPYDVYQLKKGLGLSFEQLLNSAVTLGVVDGLIRPSMAMLETGKTDANGEPDSQCVFLNEEGRCKIHGFRPGLCRLFPLGRIYEDGKIGYILLKDECARENRTKEKVHKWIGLPDMASYEKYLFEWHDFLKRLAEAAGQESEEVAKQANMYILQKFYMEDVANGFYEDFYKRLEIAKMLL